MFIKIENSFQYTNIYPVVVTTQTGCETHIILTITSLVLLRLRLQWLSLIKRLVKGKRQKDKATVEADNKEGIT